MSVTRPKLAALLIAAFYALLAALGGGPDVVKSTLTVAAFVLIPLVLIWFPDELGSFKGLVRGGYIDRETPGCVLAAAGWALLVGVPLALFLYDLCRRCRTNRQASDGCA
jgi:hypothetical protein